MDVKNKYTLIVQSTNMMTALLESINVRIIVNNYM